MVLCVPELRAPVRHRLDDGILLGGSHRRCHRCGSRSVLDSQGRLVHFPSEQDR